MTRNKAKSMARLLEVALPLAERHGYRHVTQTQIAEAAGVSRPLVVYHFGTMERFREALLFYAINAECLPVVAQAVVSGCRAAIPPGLAQRALASLQDR